MKDFFEPGFGSSVVPIAFHFILVHAEKRLIIRITLVSGKCDILAKDIRKRVEGFQLAFPITPNQLQLYWQPQFGELHRVISLHEPAHLHQ